MTKIWIIAEDPAGLAVLAAGAGALAPGSALTAFVKGGMEEAAWGIALGANTAYALPLPDKGLWENYATPLAAKAAEERPALILLAASRRCRDLAAQVAALLGAPCYSDVKNLVLGPDAVSGETLVYGGAGVATSTSTAATVLATIGPKAFEPAEADPARSGVTAVLDYPAGSTARVTERRPAACGTVNLDRAARVLGVGRGVAEQADLAALEALATALGAEMACSRPIAEFFKWMPEERYIGISGQQIKPLLYVAVGISGQAQHMYGVREARVIVAINKDPEALINHNADYCLVGDWKDVVPSLIRALGTA